MIKELKNELFIPENITVYVSGNKVVITPDWVIPKVTKAYTDSLQDTGVRNCIDSATAVEEVNLNLKFRFEDDKCFISIPTVAKGNWMECIFSLPDPKSSAYFYNNLAELALASEKDSSDESYSGISIGFNQGYPGVPFFMNKDMKDVYRSAVKNGSKYMVFTTASAFGSKRTKSWKLGYKYVDALGNQFTIIGKYNIGEDAYNLIKSGLEMVNSTRKRGNDLSFVKTVVDILNSDSSYKTDEPITASYCSVFFTIKDNCCDIQSLNDRAIDVYDDLNEFSIQMIPFGCVYPAFEVEKVFGKGELDDNPLDFLKIAENTVKAFRFGEYTHNDSLPATLNKGVNDYVIENLLYLSSIENPSTGEEIKEISELLKKVVEERFKEMILFDSECLTPTVSYDTPLESITVIKRSAVFISSLLKHSNLYETALNYLNTHIVDFEKMFNSIRTEIKDQQTFIFSSWENYARYVNYSNIPYITTNPITIEVAGDSKVFTNGIKLPDDAKITLGDELYKTVEELVNNAVIFNGTGVQNYYVSEENVNMVITYNDLKRYLKDNFTDQLKSNILSRKFYKTNINIKISK
jgi:hypothetical protein